MGEHGACVFVNDVEVPLREPTALADVIARYSPFGSEPVLATVGATTYRSIDDLSGVTVRGGERIDLFPLIIGG